MPSAVRVIIVLVVAPLLTLPLRAQDKVNYARDVQPILAENCFACHGFDEKARKAKLRLDTFEGALAKHKDVAAVVPGQPEQSEVVRRILTKDADDHMPPEETGKKLTTKQVELIKRWIAEGADYRGHWSFQAIKAPVVPDV